MALTQGNLGGRLILVHTAARESAPAESGTPLRATSLAIEIIPTFSASDLMTPRLLRNASWSADHRAHRLNGLRFDGFRRHPLTSPSYQLEPLRTGTRPVLIRMLVSPRPGLATSPSHGLEVTDADQDFSNATLPCITFDTPRHEAS